MLDTEMSPTGETVTEVCDVLIGADGIKSAVRKQLYPDDEIQYSGLMLWRATTTLEKGFLGGDTMFMAGTNEASLAIASTVITLLPTLPAGVKLLPSPLRAVSSRRWPGEI